MRLRINPTGEKMLMFEGLVVKKTKRIKALTVLLSVIFLMACQVNVEQEEPVAYIEPEVTVYEEVNQNNRDNFVPVSVEDLVGVWQTADFEETYQSFAVEMYVTNDSNLYVMFVSATEAGPGTTIFHYHYDVVDGELIWTPFLNPFREGYEEELEILFKDERIYLSMDGLSGPLPERGTGRAMRSFFRESPIILYRVSQEVPFGWTDEQQQQMADTLEWMKQEIFAHAEKYSEALGFTFMPSRGGDFSMASCGRNNVVFFNINHDYEDYPQEIGIAFGGELPSPIQARRHMGRSLNADSGLFEERSEVRNEGFWLIYRGGMPEEWIEIFLLLDTEE